MPKESVWRSGRAAAAGPLVRYRDRAVITELVDDWAKRSFACALTRPHKVPEGLDHRLQPGGLTFKFRDVILGQ